MGIDELTEPSPRQDTAVRATEEDPRLDYAWKWFNFHAEQRTKMFNYMLVGLGILATAIATMVQRGLAPGAIVLSGSGVLLCVAFLFMDWRNRYLYRLAQAVLLQIERTQLFPGDEQGGIVKELTRQEVSAGGTLRGILGGQHRYWMPFVTVIFILLFASALWFAVRVLSNQDGDTIPDKAVLICCNSEAASPRSRDGTMDPAKDYTSLIETVRFGGFAEGDVKFDCSIPSNAALLKKVDNAIQRAENQGLQAIVFLVGGTDRTALAPPLRARFESNTGLARARISAVEQCLNMSGGPAGSQLPEVIRLVTGPSYTPGRTVSQTAAAIGQARDREVQALVIGMKATRS